MSRKSFHIAKILVLRCLLALMLVVLVAPPSGGELVAAGNPAKTAFTVASTVIGVPVTLVEKPTRPEKRDLPGVQINAPAGVGITAHERSDVPRPSAGERRSLASHLIYTLTTSSRL
jgi:hypothetical protein